jgi:aldehyde dehydrogenase (NAD+)
MTTTVRDVFETMEYGPAPEADAPARAWLAAHGSRFGCYIDGAWTTPRDDALFPVTDPATGKELAQVTQASSGDVDAAVQAASRALPGWRATDGHIRARHLYALARLVQRHSRELAVLESLDNGKPIRETRDLDIPLVARHFYHHAGWAQLFDSEFPGYQSAGVVGQVIPWNFPLLMLAWKVAPALAAGCTIVIKPAEFTPLTALRFAELVHQAGLPHGVFNLVTGDGETGKAIVAHPGVHKLAFTGSTEVGRAIRMSTAGSGKTLSLELGGKSPFVVFDDADLDSVVEGVVDAIWFNQGQVCCAGSRLLVQESVAERLHDKLRARMERMRVGTPLDKAVDMGAIVAPVQLERITQLVDQGKAEGIACWQPSWRVPSEGLFFPPTLFTNVEPASSLAQVEIFGPVLVSSTFRTPDEAVALANNTVYGLAASVWSENINLALDVAPKIKAGIVWVNCTNLFDAAAGFGGYRESGFGREGGREGMWEYVKRIPTAAATGEASTDPIVAASVLAPSIDRTPKLYIGGKQARPDSGYSRSVQAPDGTLVGEVGDGNRKDIRNAVEAAHAAGSWARMSGHARAQVLYYIAENLMARGDELATRLAGGTGRSKRAALSEHDAAVRAWFTYAAWADKHDGAVHDVPLRGVTLAMNEPLGVVATIAPDALPLLGLVSMIAPAVAMGNRVVAVPSATYPLAATDLYQIFDTSDLPGGVVNIVTGDRNALARVLADHDDVDAIWYVGDADGITAVERASAGNMKRSWCQAAESGRDWFETTRASREFLRRATQVKNIWIPYGE